MYPEDACREALTNAIAHRDYSIEGRGIEVSVYDDRMEVVSPGPLLSNVSIEDLRNLTGAHESRNTRVARVLRELGYMREMGEGMRRIYALMRAHDLVEPGLFGDQDSFRVELHHTSVFTEDAQRWLSAYDRAHLTRDEQKVMLLGRNDAVFSPQQVWDALDIVDTEDYRKIIERLQLKGLLGSVIPRKRAGLGRKKVARYIIRSAQDFERYLGDLLKALATVSHTAAISAGTIRQVRPLLMEGNPYAGESRLRYALQLLGLTDSDDRPIGRLRAVLETRESAPRPRTRTTDPPRHRQTALTPTEERELRAEAVPRLYVGNLPFDTTPEAVRGHFERFGDVRSISMPRDFETGRFRGFCFVEFGSLDVARSARAAAGEIGGRSLRLDWARPK
jgi:ATP-dependent DNA helicase RecG